MTSLHSVFLVVFSIIVFKHLQAMDGPTNHPDLLRRSSIHRRLTRTFFEDCKSNGKNPNHLVTSKEKRTPLIELCASDQHESYKLLVIKKLLDCGGLKPNVQDTIGNTALHYACMSDHFEVIEQLMSIKSIDALIKNKDGQSPLQILMDKKKSIERIINTIWSDLSVYEERLIVIIGLMRLFDQKNEMFPRKNSVGK